MWGVRGWGEVTRPPPETAGPVDGVSMRTSCCRLEIGASQFRWAIKVKWGLKPCHSLVGMMDERRASGRGHGVDAIS